MPTPTLTLFGFDGTTHPTHQQLLDTMTAELHREHGIDMTNATDRQVSQAYLRVAAGVDCARYHNKIASKVAAYHTVAGVARAAIAAVDDAYADLGRRTTTAWHAAHHRYITALEAARRAHAGQIAAILELHEATERHYSGLVKSFYDQLVPADQRLNIPDTTGVVDQINAFRDENTARLQTLSHTLAGTFPTGYEPTPVAAPQHSQPDTEAWA